jgi:heme/copper-type cytochrome/quinol oxidase subunit 3
VTAAAGSISGAVPAPDVVTPTTAPGYGTAWWGMVALIMTEATIFAGLLASYFFLRAASKQWPPPGVELPPLRLALVFSVVLWGSSAPVVWAEHAIKRGRLGAVRAGLLVSAVMGAGFLGYTLHDFDSLTFGWRDHAYGSIFYTTVGLHALHVFVGLLMSVIVQIKAWQGKFSAERHVTLQMFGLYWHFVDAVWVFVFASLIVSPHIR